uniref:Uncharacterized protein n=1 Tax=Cannabis sativa TaxID=3483 RepID=A0A803PE98_CANSA
MVEMCSSLVTKLSYKIKVLKVEHTNSEEKKEEAVKALNKAKARAEAMVKQRVKASLNDVVTSFLDKLKISEADLLAKLKEAEKVVDESKKSKEIIGCHLVSSLELDVAKQAAKDVVEEDPETVLLNDVNPKESFILSLETALASDVLGDDQPDSTMQTARAEHLDPQTWKTRPPAPTRCQENGKIKNSCGRVGSNSKIPYTGFGFGLNKFPKILGTIVVVGVDRAGAEASRQSGVDMSRWTPHGCSIIEMT